MEDFVLSLNWPFVCQRLFLIFSMLLIGLASRDIIGELGEINLNNISLMAILEID